MIPWLALAATRPLVFGVTTPLLVFGLPWVLRIAVAASLGLVLGAAAAVGGPAPAGSAWMSAFLGELVVGLVLALAAGVGVWTAQGAGRAWAAAAAPAAAGPLAAPLAELLGLGAGATLLAAGAHRPLLRILGESARVLPVGQAGSAWVFTGAGEAAIELGSGVVGAVASVAMPAFAASLTVLAAVSVGRRAAARAGPRLLAAIGHAPLGALAAVAALAAAASVGLFDEAALRSWEAGRGIAGQLLQSWRAGP